MKIIKAEWELRNLGVLCQEAEIEAEDSLTRSSPSLSKRSLSVRRLLITFPMMTWRMHSADFCEHRMKSTVRCLSGDTGTVIPLLISLHTTA